MVRALKYSPDGRSLAWGGDDGSVTIGDPVTAEERLVLNALRVQVGSLAFSPDGQTLMAGQFDGSVTLWDLAPRLPTAASGR